MNKNILPIAGLIIACSLAYHYVVYVPNRDESERVERVEASKAQILIEQKKAEEKKLEEYNTICVKKEEKNMEALLEMISFCGQKSSCHDEAIATVPVGASFVSNCVNGYQEGTWR